MSCRSRANSGELRSDGGADVVEETFTATGEPARDQ